MAEAAGKALFVSLSLLKNVGSRDRRRSSMHDPHSFGGSSMDGTMGWRHWDVLDKTGSGNRQLEASSRTSRRGGAWNQRFGNWIPKLACVSLQRKRDRGYEGCMSARCEEDGQKSGERGCGLKLSHQTRIRTIETWSMGGTTTGVEEERQPSAGDQTCHC